MREHRASMLTFERAHSGAAKRRNHMKCVDFYAASCRKPLQNRVFYGTATLGNADGFGGGDSCVFSDALSLGRARFPDAVLPHDGAGFRKVETVAHSHTADTTRRDFLYIATGAATAVGAASVAWPLVDQMNPAANVLALASTEVDISAIQPGQMIRVMWRGRPTFIRHLTPEEISETSAVPLADLIDQTARNGNLPDNAEATAANRLASPAAEGEMPAQWLIVVGVCTHLGCIPASNAGDYGGWLCACHGSQYDAAGRVRVGPAPENLMVPPFAFLSETRVRIG